MNIDLWERLKPLFHAALERDPKSRYLYVDEVCAEDVELRQHLLRLLKAEQDATGPIGVPVDVDTSFQELASRFVPGDLILNRFRIVRQAGKGGMGEVYETEDLELGKVALKTIRPEIAGSPEALRRLRLEVQMARKVSAPQICRIHELFVVPAANGHPMTTFLTMEFVEGVTLAEKVRVEGPLPFRQALPIALEICEGMSRLHEKGIIHRDLKTSNIMLSEGHGYNRTVLMDFGLAHLMQDRRPNAETASSQTQDSDRTRAGAVLGTPECMAPEQFEGGAVSPATDVYALGIILYEMVTGVHPYAADTPFAAAIRRARHPKPASAVRSKVPRYWDRIIGRCLQYEPSDRFSSAAEVARALRAGSASIENIRKDHIWVVPAVAAITFALLTWSAVEVWRNKQVYRPKAEAQTYYDKGLLSLRNGTYLKATRLLDAAARSDSRFAMARVRMAEAWNDLDFQQDAQNELLLAAPEIQHLSPLDRMYYEAVRYALVGEYLSSAAVYSRILNRLPATEKSAGYVDLGWAYERAADIGRALQCYAKASEGHGNPAALMHEAILQSRLYHSVEAQKAFEEAQAVFQLEGDEDDRAELNYQRGYASNDRGDSQGALPYLQHALSEADESHNVQLQIRTLTQLSSATARYDAAQSADYANQAIGLAQTSGLTTWAANGLVRLGMADLRLQKMQEARKNMENGLQLAHQSRQLRAEALANVALASLANQEHHPEQVSELAKVALDYYQTNGFFAPAINASTLLIRAKRDQGKYEEALIESQSSLALATRSGNHELMRQTEELLGSVLLTMERFPDALPHFLRAEALADAPSSREYEALNAADALWKMGRYTEFDSTLRFTPSAPSFASAVGTERAQSLLSQKKYGEVLSLCKTLLARSADISLGDRDSLLTVRAVAESHLKMRGAALADLHTLNEEHVSQQADTRHALELIGAEINLSLGHTEEARREAASAASFFHSTGSLDSELRGVCLAALAARAQNDTSAAASYGKRAVDIRLTLAQTWNPEATRFYFSRPDLSALLQGVVPANPIPSGGK